MQEEKPPTNFPYTERHEVRYDFSEKEALQALTALQKARPQNMVENSAISEWMGALVDAGQRDAQELLATAVAKTPVRLQIDLRSLTAPSSADTGGGPSLRAFSEAHLYMNRLQNIEPLVKQAMKDCGITARFYMTGKPRPHTMGFIFDSVQEAETFKSESIDRIKAAVLDAAQGFKGEQAVLRERFSR